MYKDILKELAKVRYEMNEANNLFGELLFKVERISQINNIITNSEKLIDEVYKYIDNSEVSIERDILDPANKLAQAIAEYREE